MEEYITRFSTYLFWDVNKDDLDMEKHSQYIIKRVLEYGMLQDWNIVKNKKSILNQRTLKNTWYHPCS